VTTDPQERRAFDAVLVGQPGRVGLEAITRLVDAQAQVRGATLKQESGHLERMVLVLADTRLNRAAVRQSAPTLAPAFPMSTRAVLRALRRGALPAENGILLV
jgi:hypothetical protein